MSNIIDNLVPTEKTAKTSSSSTTGQTVKDKPSFFDSLLSNIPKEDLVSDNKISSGKEIKKDEVLNSTLDNETNENITLSSDEISSSDKEQKNTTSSLLDRLIIEAKKGTNQVSNIDEKTNIKKEDTPLLNKEDIPLVDNTEIKVEQINSSEVKKEEISDLSSTDLSEDLKSTTNKIVDSSLVNKSNEDLTVGSPKIEENTTKDIVTKNKVEENTTKDVVIKNKVEENILEVVIPKTELNSNNLIESKVDVEQNNDKNVTNLTIKDTSSDMINSKIQMNDIDINSNNLTELVVDGKEKSDNKITNDLVIDPSVNKIKENDTKLNTDLTILKDSKVISTEKKEILTNNILDNKLIEVEKNTENNISEKVDFPKEKESLSLTQLLDNNLEESSTLSNQNSTDLLDIKDDEKNNIKSINVKKDQKISLMDQLILKNSSKTPLNIMNSNINPSEQEIIGKDFISSLYLGSQKNKINNQTLFNKNEAVNLLKDGTSIDAIKTSAEMLDLGLESIDLDNNIEIEKVEVKNVNLKIENKKDFIENILLDKNIKSDDIKGLITKSVDASNALIEDTIHLADDSVVSVNSPLSFNIQSKIIGAKQQMATMMSDIAKQMYENYKPPVTAFRINLHPTTLGSIAILMKSDKNNGLSISMNVSNHSTLDALVENQNVLKNSLGKTFNENTQFNLDFSSSNQNSNNQSSSNNQSAQGQSGRKIEPQMDTQSILQLKEENKDREEKSIDYM